MTRRGLFGALFQNRALPDQEFYDRVLAHEKVWDRFIRKLFGCPKEGPTTAETCSVGNREIDYKDFAEARRTACKLFELREK
jgi:hypothetical protein